jgi:hypothetical protein
MDAKFKIYTGMLRAYEVKSADGSMKKRFKTTASSTIKDLAGDEIQYPAIEKMAAKARENMTIFLNHSYNVPEDVLGSCEDAQVMKRGVDGDGNDIIDLDFDIALNEVNERAVKAWESINNGVKLGTSIGAIVRHATKKKGGGLLIDDVDLLEASLVGIPANPRSWVQYAVKGLGQVEDPIIDEEVDADFDITEAADIPVDSDTVEVFEKSEDPAEETVEAPAEETTKAACPDCGKGHDSSDCSNPFHKKDSAEDEIDKEAARTRVTVTVDSEPAQEAPKSDPGNATASLLDETAQGDNEALGDNLTLGIEGIEKFAQLVERLDTSLSQVATLTKKLSETETERDEALANLELAKQLFSRIEQLPLRRKTALTPTDDVKDFRKFAGYLDDNVIQLLEKK